MSGLSSLLELELEPRVSSLLELELEPRVVSDTVSNTWRSGPACMSAKRGSFRYMVEEDAGTLIVNKEQGSLNGAPAW